jgi:hypothetical protein
VIEYIIALIAVAIIAWLLKVKMKASALVLAFILFLIASFIWGAVANYFKIQPSDLIANLLYSLVAFVIFWLLWHLVGKKANG